MAPFLPGDLLPKKPSQPPVESPGVSFCPSCGLKDPSHMENCDFRPLFNEDDIRHAKAVIPKAPEPKASEKQVGGDHYKLLAIQPMEYALANHLNYAQANVIKYVTRYNLKADGAKWKEDLKKAIHNIELLIEHEEKTRAS